MVFWNWNIYTKAPIFKKSEFVIIIYSEKDITPQKKFKIKSKDKKDNNFQWKSMVNNLGQLETKF